MRIWLRTSWATQTEGTRLSTNTLRGIAGLSVVLNHFLKGSISGSLGGFANAIVAIFFLLSGYGIYLSLAKRGDRLGMSSIARFYGNRVLRFLPIALALGVLAPLQGQGFVDGMASLLKYWFIVSILHCYVIAIPSFLIARRWPRTTAVALGLLTVIGIVLRVGRVLPPSSARWMHSMHLIYREIPLGHVFIFALGMVLARLNPSLNFLKDRRAVAALSSLGTLAFMVVLKALAVFRGGLILEYCFAILPLAPILSSTWLAIQEKAGLKLLAVIGTASLPIYILNGGFRGAVLRLVGGASLGLEIVLFVLLLPVYLAACIVFQTTADRSPRLLRKVLHW